MFGGTAVRTLVSWACAACAVNLQTRQDPVKNKQLLDLRSHRKSIDRKDPAAAWKKVTLWGKKSLFLEASTCNCTPSPALIPSAPRHSAEPSD